MSVSIFSTLTCDNEYGVYGEKTGDMEGRALIKSVLIKGGSNLIDGRTLLTPIGVHTLISDDDYEAIKDNSVFRMHVANGFIIVKEKGSATDNAEKVAADMATKDEAAPLTEADYAADEAPTTKKKK